MLVCRVSVDRTASRAAARTHLMGRSASGLLQGRRPASEGGLKSFDVHWVLAVALQQIREAVLAETRPSGSPRSLNEICSNSRKKKVPELVDLGLGGANRAPPIEARTVLGTALENFGPQAPRGRKRQRPGRSAAAVRPGGLPRCPHRLGHPT